MSPKSLICIFSISIAFSLAYFLLNTNYMYSGSHEVLDMSSLTSSETTSIQSSEADTVCRFPKVNPFDPAIMELSGLNKSTLRCNQYFMPDLTYVDGLSIRINLSKVKEIGRGFSYCQMRSITRPPFHDNNYTFSAWGMPFNTSLPITDEDEFLQVQCYDEKKEEVVSKTFYSLVPKKEHLDQLYEVKMRKRLILFEPQETLSIVMMTLDGLPRHQMLRAMPKTYKYMTETLASFDFQLHQQVGSDTLTNMLAVLSGKSLPETKRWWSFKNDPEDAFGLIWRDFERAGFRTLYTEDNPRTSGFYWGKRSFLNPQASYWNRPLQLAMRDEKGYFKNRKLCAGAHPISQYQLEYVTRFLDTFSQKPVACGVFIGRVTHDDSTNAKLIDDHFLEFLEALQMKGHLSRSLVMFFSDHGHRWGAIRKTYNGMVESRNPFLLLAFPGWFLKKNPDIAATLDTNTRRLTTHFDTYQMLLDLIYFKSKVPTPPYRGRYGLSLFTPIPANRTCREAEIPRKYCLCGKGLGNFISAKSSLATSLAETLLHAVKAKSHKKLCEEYTLGRVLQVRWLTLPMATKEEKSRHDAFTVRITVQPGEGIFEGVVYMDKVEKHARIAADIERLDAYKGEVECRPTSAEQIFCYCKGNNRRQRKGLM